MNQATRPLIEADSSPESEYLRRRQASEAEATRQERLLEQLANARLLIAAGGLILLYLALVGRSLAPWWLAVPAVLFLGLLWRFGIVSRAAHRASWAASHYARGLDRLAGKWSGRGEPGSRFLDPDHPYAADLDLFGKGSLFELLCAARTQAGEETLASWLLAPAPPEEVRQRQEAVAELRPLVDFRADLALLGSGVRSGIEAKALAFWGSEPPILPGAPVRVIAALLGLAGGAALVGWAAFGTGLLPFLATTILELAFFAWLSRRVQRVLEVVDRRAHDLRLLAGLLERLEREPLHAPRLRRILDALAVSTTPPSRQVARLARLVDRLEWQRNALIGPFLAVLLWGTSHALAIEAWRRRSGGSVAGWLAAIGEIEALASLATFAYENPADPFPDLVSGSTQFDAHTLAHPLILRSLSVSNDVRLDTDLRLLVVSGSNMSGKSTLLRAVGVNAVLAQAGATVRASSLRLSPLAVGGTMRVQDSLQSGQSRFYAEIVRLRALVSIAERSPPLLFLLDELLSGTNSHDRRLGAEGVVRGLLDRGAIGLITTHDLALTEIAERLAPLARNVHFEDQLIDGQIRFDYRMRSGVVTHSNALELMRAVGLDV